MSPQQMFLLRNKKTYYLDVPIIYNKVKFFHCRLLEKDDIGSMAEISISQFDVN